MDARRALACCVAVAATLSALAGPGFGAPVPRASCLDCHEQEGMKYATIIVSPLLELGGNESFPFEVVVANPWLHDITDTTVVVRLASTNVRFETRAPFDGTEEGVLSNLPGEDEFSFDVPVASGATGAVIRMVQDAGPGAVDADLYLATPLSPELAQAQEDGVRPPPAPSGTPRPSEAFSFDAAGVAAQGTGNWTATARLARVEGSDVRPPGRPTPVTLEAHVFYNTTTSQTQRQIETVKEAQSTTFRFLINGVEPGPARIDVATILTAHYIHPKGIGAQDDGNTTLTTRVQFAVGGTTRLGEQTALAGVAPRNWNLIATVWGEATGWVGLFLIPVSLVLGGAFGRRNVLWMNKVARNGRTRVLWHNAVSFVLLLFTIVHIVLFIIEPRYQWSVGLVWGGLGTLALLGLAVTGLWWRGIARTWGYHNWRMIHIAFAIAFVATTLVHVLAEGAHFDWAREAFGFA